MQTKTKPLEQLSSREIYWQLFKSIFVINASTFGGGFAIIGMIKHRFCEVLGWISEEEIMDMTAIAQSSPGPLGVNMAIITGYRIRKISGALVCASGAVLPPLIIISIVALFYEQVKDNPIIALLLKVMRAGVAAVIVSVVIDLGKRILQTKNLFWVSVMIIAFLLSFFFHWNAILLIVVCGTVGWMYSFWEEKGGK